MSSAKSNRMIYWLVFLVSLVAFVAFLAFKPEWFWITLPFMLTSLVKAFDVM